MQIPAAQKIPRLHARYIALTGLAIPLDPAREREWFEWANRIEAAGTHPEAALDLVVDHLKKGIKAGTRNPGALKFRNLIGQPDYFEEDLAEARAQARNQKSQIANPKSAILQATGRPVAEPAPGPRSAAQILASEKAFEQFRKVKEQL